jgi:putative nucleotidyltransferase with HDIG domain
MVNPCELIRQARELEPLPASTIRLAGLVSSENVDLDEICEVITYDQALTLALLRAANSAAHAGVSDVSQVYEAVFRLGAAHVLALALAANTGKLLKKHLPAYGLDEGALWRHSVAAVTAAESLAKYAAEDLPPETFTAALLHDVGKLVMGRFISASDIETIHRARIEGGLDLQTAERQVMGMDHAELGGIIALHWKLPERIIKGITYHHNPIKGQDLICDAVYLANQIAKRTEKPAPWLAVSREALAQLGLAESQMDEVTAVTLTNFESVRARYG